MWLVPVDRRLGTAAKIVMWAGSKSPKIVTMVEPTMLRTMNNVHDISHLDIDDLLCINDFQKWLWVSHFDIVAHEKNNTCNFAGCNNQR